MSRLVRVAALIVFVLSLVVLLPAESPQVEAQADSIYVVASTTIIADVVANVAGDAAVVEPLMGPGQNPHAFEPSGEDLAVLSEADVIFVNGAYFEEGLLPIFEEGGIVAPYEISACVNILSFDFALGHHHADDEEHHDEEAHDEEHEHDDEEHHDEEAHDEEHEHDDEEHHDEEAHDEEHEHSEMAAQCMAHHEKVESMLSEESHAEEGDAYLGYLYTLDCDPDHDHEGEGEHTHVGGSCDSHVWTNPTNVMLWTLYARDVLSELDPENADVYAANAEAYLAELADLDEQIHTLFEPIPVEQRVMVTNHGAFGYMAHRYNLRVVGTVIPGGGTAAEPSAEDVAELIEVIEDNDVLAIFTENTVSDTLANQIAEETGADIYGLLTGSLTGPDGEAPTYIDYMLYNATNMAKGMSD